MGAVEGVLAAAVTPRAADSGVVDLAAALDLFDFLSSSGVRGIVLFGATGEFPHFELEDRIRLAGLSVRRSTLPVLVNVTHSSLDGALRLAREADRAGAAGVLIMPPYFFRYRQPEVREFLLRFAALAPGSLSRFLYNIPFFTTALDQETVSELLTSGAYAGIKDSSGDWNIMQQLLELSKTAAFTLLAGNDVIYTQARLAGAQGSVSGVACAAPELLVALDRAIRGGDSGTVEILEARLQEFIRRIDAFPTPVGVREAVAARGLHVGPLAAPLAPETERMANEFREWFTGWLHDVNRECAKASLEPAVGTPAP